MANKSISQLTAGIAIASTDIFPDVQTVGVGPVKVTALQMGNYVLGGTYDAGITYSTSGKSLTLGVQSTTAGALVLANTNAGTYPVTLQSSNSTTGAWTMTLPVSGGTSGYVLTTNGSGVTAWSDPTIIGIDINVGTTAIVGGTSGGIIWNNAGVVGNTTAMSTNGSAALTLGTQQTTQGTLVLANTAAGAYPVTVQASNSTSVAWTFTLPVTAGTNGFILTTNGSGVSAWTNPTALGVDLDVGTTAITNGTSGRVLYDNAGVLGEYLITGTGDVVLNNNPTFVDDITLGTQQTTRGSIVLANTAAGAFPVTLQSSNSTSAAWTFTLPTTAGTNAYLLTTDGSGNMSWTNPTTIGGLPGGTNGQIQYNNSGAFGGASAITTNGTSTMTFGTQQTTQGSIVLANTVAGSFSTTIQSSNSASAAWTLTLPVTAGTNGYVLTTNGSGVTSWAASAGATITNDTSTATAVYPVFANATSGSLTTAYTSNANLTYTPSTGTFLSVAVGSSSGVVLNANTISVVYSIPSGYNAFSSGPVTVASGGSITVPSGSNWTVV